jgi:hypothetical protein
LAALLLLKQVAASVNQAMLKGPAVAAPDIPWR